MKQSITGHHTVANCSPAFTFSRASSALLCFSHRMCLTFTCVAGFTFLSGAAALHARPCHSSVAPALHVTLPL